MIPYVLTPTQAIMVALRDELDTMAEFTDRTYLCFSYNDIKDKTDYSGFPALGISYEGRSVGGNAVTPTNRKSSAGAALLDMSIMLFIGSEYSAAGRHEDPPSYYNLCDEVRHRMLGLTTANSRPWTFAGEEAIEGESGVIWMGQRWETKVLIVGETNRDP